MNIVPSQAAAELLFQTLKQGQVIHALPEALRPVDRTQAYQIQQQLESFSDKPLFGWKIAATSAAGQAHIGIDGPIAGRVFAETVYQSADVIPFGANRMCVAEAEFAFKMGQDLPPRDKPYQTDEVLSAVAKLHLAIETPDSRFEDFVTAGGPQLIADNACAYRFILGPQVPESWRALDLAAHQVVGRVNNTTIYQGCGANVLGDPRVALTWLVNELSSLGITLKAGQIVTTGTTTVPMPIKPGDTVVGDFGALGKVSCSFLPE